LLFMKKTINNLSRNHDKKQKQAKIRVLIVDDHALVREGLRMILEIQPDISVIAESADGNDGVEQAQKLKPDIVIMDISMPKLNGIDAASQINKSNPEIKIIILSMHDTSEHIRSAFKAGAQGYLLKECAGSDIVNAIRTVHSGRRYLSKRVENIVIDDYIDGNTHVSEKNLLENLNKNEIEILRLIVEGKSNTEIAQNIHVSLKTVETYKCRIMGKLGVDNLPCLVKFAIKYGLTA